MVAMQSYSDEAPVGSHVSINDSLRPTVFRMKQRKAQVVSRSGNTQVRGKFGSSEVANGGQDGSDKLVVRRSKKTRYRSCVKRFKLLYGHSLLVCASTLTAGGKDQLVDRLRADSVVAFIGDGINDSIALSSADVGIGMGSGTEAAMLASDVILLGSDIHRMLVGAWQVAVSARSHAIVALLWCGRYITVAILLGSGAAVAFRIPAHFAGLGEMVSVAPVLLIALSAKVRRDFEKRGERDR